VLAVPDHDRGRRAVSALRHAAEIRRHWRPWLFLALSFAAVGVLRWPLLGVVGALAPFAVAISWWRNR
jgi:hypothetical protein